MESCQVTQRKPKQPASELDIRAVPSRAPSGSWGLLAPNTLSSGGVAKVVLFTFPESTC